MGIIQICIHVYISLFQCVKLVYKLVCIFVQTDSRVLQDCGKPAINVNVLQLKTVRD